MKRSRAPSTTGTALSRASASTGAALSRASASTGAALSRASASTGAALSRASARTGAAFPRASASTGAALSRMVSTRRSVAPFTFAACVRACCGFDFLISIVELSSLRWLNRPHARSSPDHAFNVT